MFQQQHLVLGRHFLHGIPTVFLDPSDDILSSHGNVTVVIRLDKYAVGSIPFLNNDTNKGRFPILEQDVLALSAMQQLGEFALFHMDKF